MKTRGWLPCLAVLALAAAPTSAAELLALRVGRAETIEDGTIENAVILIEDGKIVAVGEDLPVERGIPVFDRPDWVALPGLVSAYTRIGMDSRAGSENQPQLLASGELLPRNRDYRRVLESGVTTLGLYPPGTGIPGQAVAVRPLGETRDDMLIAEGVYLKILFRSDSKSKKLIRDGFKELDEYEEKERKAREKFEKDLEKAKKKKDKDKKKKKDDDKKDEEKDDDKKSSAAGGDEEEPLPTYSAPEPDPKVPAFRDLREGELHALVSIGKSGDYLHLLDALGDEDVELSLRVRVTTNLDLFHIAEELGEAEMRLVMEPRITRTPGTMRQRNLPLELHSEGARIVFIPRSDTIWSYESWLLHVGRMVAAGLPRDVALRAVTLEPAELLGLGERLGSLAPGKDANIVLFDGDPLEAGTEIEAVLLEGQVVHGELNR